MTRIRLTTVFDIEVDAVDLQAAALGTSHVMVQDNDPGVVTNAVTDPEIAGMHLITDLQHHLVDRFDGRAEIAIAHRQVEVVY
ncbi:hypothetical protein [Arthrobacter celericrescens]|uniref:hypothetical protein n=1 Tax=Arthrobacter celericrescens TaxID=2320851 RepID=UPI000EA0424A|nr:hypothetical protein [Arthrobacter celericrescens]